MAVASTSSRITTDHDAIRCWAEERDARPVEGAGGDGDPGTVRLEFPGSRDTSTREIAWDEWFQKFDAGELALLYQEQAADGERSFFCKIVQREKADEVESALGGRGRSAARKGSPRAKKTARRSAVASAANESARAGTEKTAGKSAHPAQPAATASRADKNSNSQEPDRTHKKPGIERTTMSHVEGTTMRSDEDPPIPIPPGEDPPSPVKEPPDTPVIAPDSPVREPGPTEPRRL